MRMLTASDLEVGDSVSDIGVGFSQAFPILVQLAVMPKRSRLIIEQPELHLYPFAQSRLGYFLCSECDENDKPLIIETHSEHIIRGIQLYVSDALASRPASFKNTDVCILYVHRNGEVEELPMNEFGELVNKWPPGFFDQGISDIHRIMTNKRAYSWQSD
jgi:predicted ATPase